MVLALHDRSGFSNPSAHQGQKETDEDGDNRYHHQQLNQREAGS
jgi:hypothetical protein